MGEAESQPTEPDKAGDISNGDMKESHTSGKKKANNLGRGLLDCITMIVVEAQGRAPAAQASCHKIPRLAKEGEGIHKRMCMTEVEKLKKVLDDPKKQRVLRGSKEKVEKVADPNNKEGKDTQQNMKGTRKNSKKTITIEKNTENNSNINVTTCQHISAISLGEVQK